MLHPAPVLMFLSQEQLITLTGRKRAAGQCQALDQMGIPYHRRPDGRPVVVAESLTARHNTADQPPTAPDWNALWPPGTATSTTTSPRACTATASLTATSPKARTGET